MEEDVIDLDTAKGLTLQEAAVSGFLDLEQERFTELSVDELESFISGLGEHGVR